MASASILLGGIGAVGRDSLEGVFAYSSIGQVGFIAIPVAIAATTTAPGLRKFAIIAALVYALNHTLAKGLLFLAVGTVKSATRTSRFADLGGLASRSPPLAISVFVGSLSPSSAFRRSRASLASSSSSTPRLERGPAP